MSSGNSIKPDLNVRSELFRVQHYLKVYNLALDLTGSIDVAKELSELVFENAARLFEHHPIPENCDKYLTAQVYLLYAQQKVPTDSSGVSTAFPAYSPKAAGAAPVAQDSKPERTETACKDSPGMTGPSQADSGSKANAPVSPVASEAVSEHIPVVVSKLAADETPPAESSTPAAFHVVYDKRQTEFWTPDLEMGSAQPDDEFEEEDQEMEEEVRKPSVQLSLLNAFLVIACLASIVFLLSELKILPRLI